MSESFKITLEILCYHIKYLGLDENRLVLRWNALCTAGTDVLSYINEISSYQCLNRSSSVQDYLQQY